MKQITIKHDPFQNATPYQNSSNFKNECSTLGANSSLNLTCNPPHRTRPALLRTLPLSVLCGRNLTQIPLRTCRCRRHVITPRRRIKTLPVERVIQLARLRRWNIARLNDLVQTAWGFGFGCWWRGLEWREILLWSRFLWWRRGWRVF